MAAISTWRRQKLRPLASSVAQQLRTAVAVVIRRGCGDGAVHNMCDCRMQRQANVREMRRGAPVEPKLGCGEVHFALGSGLDSSGPIWEVLDSNRTGNIYFPNPMRIGYAPMAPCCFQLLASKYFWMARLGHIDFY